MTTTGAAPGPDHRTALWDAMLDADLNVFYWTAMTRRYTFIENVSKAIVAISSSGTVAAWGLWEAHAVYYKTLSGIACVASIILPLFYSTETLKRMSALVGTWRELLISYELLWEQDDSLSEGKNWKRFEALRQRHVDEARLPRSKRLLWEAAKEVRQKRGLKKSESEN